MKTSVYFSLFNRTIKVVCGEFKGKQLAVSRCLTMQMPPDHPDPGYVWDGRAAALYEFWEENKLPRKNVRLILDTDAAVTKKLETPPMSKKQILNLVENEFADQLEEDRKYLFDYTVLAPGGKKDEDPGMILAAAVEMEPVNNYSVLAERLGIALDGIDIAQASAIRLLRRVGGGKHSFICAVLEENKIALFMFLNGVYSFFNMGLILEERGTPAAAVEISRQISSLIQFNISQRSEAEISAAFICGLTEDEMLYCDNMSQSLNIPVSVLPDEETLIIKTGEAVEYSYCCGDFLYALGGLYKD